MRKLQLILLAILCSVALFAEERILAENEKAKYVIFFTPQEKDAALELQLHLSQISGAKFRAIPIELSHRLKSPAFYLGKTPFAEENKVPFDKFMPQEWYVKTVGKDIIIAGGNTRGTLYGVYELLERQFNCRWFAPDTSVIPEMKKCVLPDIELRGKPSYDWLREIRGDLYTAPSRGYYKETLAYEKRARATLVGERGIYPERSRQHHYGHSLYYYVNPKELFATHPEYFSMNAEGKRFVGTISGWNGSQVCFSNPEVAEVAWKKLEEFIKKDRENTPKEQWPTVYGIGQMDSTTYLCLCPNCKKIAEEEGSESALLLRFLNVLAERAEKKYPEIRIDTYAYSCARTVCKYTRPRKNISVQWTNLYGRNDCYRPITHPVNAGQFKEYHDWLDHGVRLDVYEYWNMGGRFFDPPRVETCIDAIIVNLPYYHKHGARRFYCEFHGDYDRYYSQNFARLQNYIGYRLLYNVDLDAEKAIREFMKGFYGPAEKPMSEFLQILREAVKKEKKAMTAWQTHRSYYTEAFMKKVWSLLEEAYKLTPENSIYRTHIEDEMIAPLHVICRNHWNGGKTEELAELYKKIRTRRIEKTNKGKFQQQRYEKLEADLTSFKKLDLKVPDEFKDKEVIMLGYPALRQGPKYHSATAFEADPEAAGGKALITPGNGKYVKDREVFHRMDYKPNMSPLDFCVYDSETQRSTRFTFLNKKHVPATDEKYHWYKIGKFKLGKKSSVWGFYWMTQCDLQNCYRPDDGMEDLNTYTIYVSAKFTGPAYVPGSKKKNEVYWDQVMLVREKPGKK